MSTRNLCFEQKYEKYQNFLFDFFFQFLEVKLSIYLNRRVVVMQNSSGGKSRENDLLHFFAISVHLESL